MGFTHLNIPAGICHYSFVNCTLYICVSRVCFFCRCSLYVLAVSVVTFGFLYAVAFCRLFYRQTPLLSVILFCKALFASGRTTFTWKDLMPWRLLVCLYVTLCCRTVLWAFYLWIHRGICFVWLCGLRAELAGCPHTQTACDFSTEGSWNATVVKMIALDEFFGQLK